MIPWTETPFATLGFTDWHGQTTADSAECVLLPTARNWNRFSLLFAFIAAIFRVGCSGCLVGQYSGEVDQAKETVEMRKNNRMAE